MTLRVTVWVRHHRVRLLVTALLVGVVGGLAMGIVAGTRRTASAPDRYTQQAGGDPDLVITQLSGPPLTEDVAALPGVRATQAIVFVPAFLVSPLDGTPLLEPKPYAGDDDAVGARLVEGRFTDPANPNEFTVNRDLAQFLHQRFGTRVGDEFDVVAFTSEQVVEGFDWKMQPEVPPFKATLVGVTESPTHFDEPQLQMVFPTAFLDAHPEVGVVQTIIAAQLEDGTDPRAVLDAVRQLPNGSDAFNVPTRVISESARRAVSFQVTALWLVGAVSLVAAAIVIAQIVSRTTRSRDEDRLSMLALGWRRRELAAESAAEGGLAALVAVPIAGLVAYAVTAMFPLGVLRSFEPDPGPSVDWLVTAVGAIGLAGVVVATAGVAGLRRGRTAAAWESAPGLSRTLPAWSGDMPLRVGARFAWSGRAPGRWTALLASGLGAAGLIGAAIVGLTLTNILDRPARWGVNFDEAFGNPYTSADGDHVTPLLDNPDVVAVTGATLGSVTIDGSDTATLAFDAATGGLVPTVLRGRAPQTAGEVDVGDRVEVLGTSGEARQLGVVGIVATPNSAGNGAAMTFDAYRGMNPQATKNVVLVDFRDGAPISAVDAVAATIYSPPGTMTTPTSIRALERVTAAPFLLALVLALLLVVACAYVLATSARNRGRDLAILRALGSDSRQLGAVVHWQASLVAVAIVLIGVPLGIVLGRSIVALLTDALGIVPGAQVPFVVLAAIVVTALVVANLLAILPARRAARRRVAHLSLDR